MSRPGPVKPFNFDDLEIKILPTGDFAWALNINLPAPEVQPVTEQPTEGKYFRLLPQEHHVPPEGILKGDYYFPGVSEYVQTMDEIAKNSTLSRKQRKRRRQKAKHKYKKFLAKEPQGTCNLSSMAQDESVKNGS